VVAAVREKHPHWRLVAVVPRGWGVGIRPGAVALRTLDGLVDTVVIEVTPGEYRSVTDFAAADLVRRRFTRMADLLLRLEARASRRGPQSVPVRALRAVAHTVGLLAPGGRRVRWSAGGDCSIALVDAHVMDRSGVQALLCALGDPPCLSLSHGLGYLDPATDAEGGGGVGTDTARRPSVQRAYAYSPQHRRRLMQDHGLPEDSVRVTGIPRHDPEGPLAVMGASGGGLGDGWDGAVLLISRPATSAGEEPTSPNDWLPKGRKAARLRAIHQVVCVERGLRLVVTMHPKERDDHEIRAGLPYDEAGRTWILIEAHPLALAPQLCFAISFSSGVAVDLLSVDVPTIEFQDVRGVSAFDRPDAARDDEGRILRTSERRHALVLAADDEADLRTQVGRIIDERDEVLTTLRAAYLSRYADPRGAVASIVTDLEAFVTGRAQTGMSDADH
jgi:hypothetical protein